MRNSRAVVFAAAAALSALSSCSKSTPASAPSVRTKAASYGNALATNAQHAVDALDAMSSVTALRNGLAPLQEALGGSFAAFSPVASGTPEFLSSRRSVRSLARLQRPAAATSGALAEDQASTMEQYLSQRVFTDANVESSDGSSVVFRLDGSDLCPYELPGGGTSLLASAGATLDPACVDDLDRQELRVKAAEPASDALDLTLMFGPGKAAPLTLELRADSAAAVVSLGGVKGLLEFEHTLDASTPLPQVMAGVVDLKVTFHRVVSGSVDVTFSSSVREAVSLAVQGSNGLTTFTTAARSPWASLEVNGIDGAVAAQLDLGQTTVTTPYYVAAADRWVQETTTLGGSSFSFSAREGQAGEFVISNLGLGDAETSVTLDGVRVLSANLAPRHFSVGFSADPAGPDRTLFTVDPQFQLTTFHDKRPYGNDDPTYAGKTYTWTLSAGAGKPQLEPYRYVVSSDPYATQWGTALEVANGTLTVSDAASAVTVQQGGCLVDSFALGTTSLVQQYASAACP